MKKLITLCIICMASVCLYSQDVIVTIDAQKIEAKILEVSKTEVRYKEFDNLDGPTFILPVEDINTIIYSKGKVVLYNQVHQNQSEEQQTVLSNTSHSKTEVLEKQMPEDSITIILLNGKVINAKLLEFNSDGIDYLIDGSAQFVPAGEVREVIFANGQVKKYNSVKSTVAKNSVPKEEPVVMAHPYGARSSGRIYRDNGHYLYNDTYISSKEVERILQREDQIAYGQWRKANGLLIGGAICTGVGAGLALGGIVWIVTGNYLGALGIECSALVPLGVGLGLTLGASAKHNKAIDIYNSKFDNAAIQLNFFTSPSGAGIALSF